MRIVSCISCDEEIKKKKKTSHAANRVYEKRHSHGVLYKNRPLIKIVDTTGGVQQALVSGGSKGA